MIGCEDCAKLTSGHCSAHMVDFIPASTLVGYTAIVPCSGVHPCGCRPVPWLAPPATFIHFIPPQPLPVCTGSGHPLVAIGTGAATACGICGRDMTGPGGIAWTHPYAPKEGPT